MSNDINPNNIGIHRVANLIKIVAKIPIEISMPKFTWRYVSEVSTENIPPGIIEIAPAIMAAIYEKIDHTIVISSVK